MSNFWQGFEKRAKDPIEDTADESNKWSTGKKLLAGGALLGAGVVGGIVGAKGYAAKLRNLKRYGGSTNSRLDKAIFGHDNANHKSFKSFYQGDTRFSHGGAFDHLKKEDITDLEGYDSVAKQYGRASDVWARGKYSPAHDAYLLKNKDGSWSSHHTTYHPPKPESEDRRLHFMSTIVDWDKKPSPEAVERTRSRVKLDFKDAKYV